MKKKTKKRIWNKQEIKFIGKIIYGILKYNHYDSDASMPAIKELSEILKMAKKGSDQKSP